MNAFRVARTAPAWRHVAVTLLQTAVFWSVFLWGLPALLARTSAALQLQPLPVPLPHLLGPLAFALFGALGLTSGLCMAIAGRGTPLPLATAREFVRCGPYRWLRNPMALAGIGQGLAVGIWRADGLVVGYALAGGVLWHVWVRPAEERDLERRFGAAFRDYRAGVPLWWPRSPRDPARASRE